MNIRPLLVCALLILHGGTCTRCVLSWEIGNGREVESLSRFAQNAMAPCGMRQAAHFAAERSRLLKRIKSVQLQKALVGDFGRDIVTVSGARGRRAWGGRVSVILSVTHWKCRKHEPPDTMFSNLMYLMFCNQKQPPKRHRKGVEA